MDFTIVFLASTFWSYSTELHASMISKYQSVESFVSSDSLAYFRFTSIIRWVWMLQDSTISRKAFLFSSGSLTGEFVIFR